MDIRPITGLAEFRAVEQLQQDIWECTDREIVPALHLIPACAVGAILLGAFDGGELVAFVYGFPGFEGDERIIHSDMLAVRESHRDRGLGRALKLAQREHALARGVRKITWTFDPLQPKNAHLNFTILGATADRYLRDFYGKTSSPLHRSGTDRLWVTWRLEGEQSAGMAAALQIEMTDREQMGREFEEAFGKGLVVCGFDRDNSRYLLRSVKPVAGNR